MWADRLHCDPGSVDVVLCNPPFHIDQHMGDQTAIAMFRASARALRAGGELWVVGNRHLGYHARLNKLFATCDVVSGDPKFVVCRAVAR